MVHQRLPEATPTEDWSPGTPQRPAGSLQTGMGPHGGAQEAVCRAQHPAQATSWSLWAPAAPAEVTSTHQSSCPADWGPLGAGGSQGLADTGESPGNPEAKGQARALQRPCALSCRRHRPIPGQSPGAWRPAQRAQSAAHVFYSPGLIRSQPRRLPRGCDPLAGGELGSNQTGCFQFGCHEPGPFPPHVNE